MMFIFIADIKTLNSVQQMCLSWVKTIFLAFTLKHPFLCFAVTVLKLFYFLLHLEYLPCPPFALNIPPILYRLENTQVISSPDGSDKSKWLAGKHCAGSAQLWAPQKCCTVPWRKSTSPGCFWFWPPHAPNWSLRDPKAIREEWASPLMNGYVVLIVSVKKGSE